MAVYNFDESPIDPEGRYYYDPEKKKFYGRGTSGLAKPVPSRGYVSSGRGATGVFSPRAIAERTARKRSVIDREQTRADLNAAATRKLTEAQASIAGEKGRIEKKYGERIMAASVKGMESEAERAPSLSLASPGAKPTYRPPPSLSDVRFADSPAPATGIVASPTKRKPYDIRKSALYKYSGAQGAEMISNFLQKYLLDEPGKLVGRGINELLRERQ